MARVRVSSKILSYLRVLIHNDRRSGVIEIQNFLSANMRLPRRVPWASLEEFEQVCNWIFFDESDQARVLAIQRLSAWKVTTALPHALDSTLALLVVSQQDHSTASKSSYLSLRQSYAAALIRLVNGLVDPLQLGVYARSIATIAAQLGLPTWLVELRHASTHEELPSLELLRQATSESLTWLLNNYFIPTLNPTSTSESQQKPLRPLIPLLKRYKSLVKTTLRDASLRTRHKPDILSILKEIEGWLSEAKVAANIAIGGLNASQETSDDEIDPQERWALDKLCDVLLDKGILVPLAKKKRVFPDDAFLPPLSSIALWSPLLTQLFDHHTDMPHILCEKIVSFITSTPNADDQKSSASYDECLARWVAWIVHHSANLSDLDNAQQLRKNVVMILLYAIIPGNQVGIRETKTELVASLLKTLCEEDEGLAAAYALLSRAQPSPSHSPFSWSPEDLDVMAQRLVTLSSLGDVYEATATEMIDQSVGDDRHMDVVAPGWRLLDRHSVWKTMPIGVYFPVA